MIKYKGTNKIIGIDQGQFKGDKTLITLRTMGKYLSMQLPNNPTDAEVINYVVDMVNGLSKLKKKIGD